MDEYTESLLYKKINMDKIVCPKCKMVDILIKEWRGAYDGWLAIECTKCKKDFHRTNLKEIVETKQPEEWWAVWFKTKGKQFFKNLREKTEKEYNVIKTNYERDNN